MLPCRVSATALASANRFPELKDRTMTPNKKSMEKMVDVLEALITRE